jgi:hypothetical protein
VGLGHNPRRRYERDGSGGDASSGAKEKKVDLKLEVVVIPVSDVGRAKELCSKPGWSLAADFPFDNGIRVVQFTPPGSGSSVQFGSKITSAAPGSAQEYLIVSDIEAAHDQLAARGVEVSEVFYPGSPARGLHRSAGRRRRRDQRPLQRDRPPLTVVEEIPDPARRRPTPDRRVRHGPEAGEWLQQVTLAIRARVPIEILRDTIQPFPTFSEICVEALKALRAEIAAARQRVNVGAR